jgi:hypothetical protein
MLSSYSLSFRQLSFLDRINSSIPFSSRTALLSLLRGVLLVTSGGKGVILFMWAIVSASQRGKRESSIGFWKMVNLDREILLKDEVLELDLETNQHVCDELRVSCTKYTLYAIGVYPSKPRPRSESGDGQCLGKGKRRRRGAL